MVLQKYSSGKTKTVSEMEHSRGVSTSSTISTRKVLFFIVGTVVSSRGVESYVTTTPLSSPCSTFSPKRATEIISNGIGSSVGSERNSYPIRTRSLRLYSSDGSTPDDSDSDGIEKDESLKSAISNVTASTTAGAQFGDVMPMKKKSSSVSSAQFGDVVSISRPSTSVVTDEASKSTTNDPPSGLSDVEMLKQRRIRNIGVAILSVALAVGNYAYQWTHPATPIQLLANMERTSAPLSDVGKNSKPTVIDFWAPWCENCRYMAPTLFQIEESYKDKVNFVMVNGDDPNNWPLIEALGVDAIPHLAMVESDGTVDTALIGAVPREWVSRDIDVLLENASENADGVDPTQKRKLPYQMLDVFANRPENRKISNLDAVVGAGRR